MEIEIKKENEKLIVSPTGRIDSLTSTEFENSIRSSLDSSIKELCLDLKNIDFVSSRGIRIFLTLHREMESTNGKLVLMNLNNSINEVLKMSSLLDVFNIQ